MKRVNFTLIEMLIVIAILGILMSLLLPSLQQAKLKTRIALCLNNQKQIGQATYMFLENNNDYFPYAKFWGSDNNTGRFWLGKSGHSNDYKVTVKQRPLNTYLGFTTNGIEVPTADCPASYNGWSHYENAGSSYMAAARQEYTDDLDHGSGSITINEIGNPVKMVLMGEVGGWHYAASNNPNPNSTMWHKPGSPMYSFSFVDGHVKNMTIRNGLGITSSSDEIFFRNFD